MREENAQAQLVRKRKRRMRDFHKDGDDCKRPQQPVIRYCMGRSKKEQANNSNRSLVSCYVFVLE